MDAVCFLPLWVGMAEWLLLPGPGPLPPPPGAPCLCGPTAQHPETCWPGRVGGAAVSAAAGSPSPAQTISQFLCSEIVHMHLIAPGNVCSELYRVSVGPQLVGVAWSILVNVPELNGKDCRKQLEGSSGSEPTISSVNC